MAALLTCVFPPVAGLLEQKGIHKEGADKPSSDAASGGSGGSGDKSSEKSDEKSGKKNPFSKLKEKLHKH